MRSIFNLLIAALLNLPVLAVEPTVNLTLSPNSGNLNSNQTNTIAVLLNTHGAAIDGIQFKLTLQGNATAQIAPASQPLLNPLIKTVSGNTITFAAITQNPLEPFSSTTDSQIATITLTPQENIDLIFDQTFTKAPQNQTSENILIPPTDAHFTIGVAESSPSPSPSPSASPEPSACNVADINQDGTVDATDRSLLLADFFTKTTTPVNPRSDINQDGKVNLFDYSLLVRYFNQTSNCTPS